MNTEDVIDLQDQGDAVDRMPVEEEALKPVEEEALKVVLRDLEISEQDRQQRESDWDKYFAKYMCYLSRSKYPWRSKVFDPETFAMIETICPRIVNSIFGAPEVFGIKPTGQEDVARAEATEHLLNHQADRMNLYPVMTELVKDSLIYGTGFGKVYWCQEFEPRYRTIPEPVTDESGTITGVRERYEKSWEIVFDQPRVDRIDIKSLYIDPAATCIEDARFIIHRFYRTRDYLKQQALKGVYHNLDKLEDRGENFSEKTDARKTQTKQQNRNVVEFQEKTMNEDELHERWGLFDIDGDGYLEQVVITVANRKTVLRVEYNKLPGGVKPFLRYTPIPVPGQFYGMSAIAPIDTLQDVLNDRTNQIGDAINLTINPMYKKVRWSDIDDDDLVSRPGGVVEMNTLADLEALNSPSFSGEAFAEIARYEGKIQKAMGTFNPSIGAMPDRQETATTTLAVQNMGDIRFKTMAILCERQVVRPLGNQQIRLNKLYLTQPRAIRILQNDAMLLNPEQMQFQMISKEMLLDDPDIYAVGAALEVGVSKEMQLNNILKFLQIVSNPIFLQHPLISINFPALLERIPYLLNLKLKQPLLVPGNPMLAYQEVQKEQELADGMMMNEMQMMQQGEMMKQNGKPGGNGDGKGKSQGKPSPKSMMAKGGSSES